MTAAVRRDVPSGGEKLVLDLLAAPAKAGETAGGWTALHSQDIAYHPGQMEGAAGLVGGS